ncbi:MAG: GMC family oxidoreductase N-terminal domain-containing protein [Pseudomonadota bacterium]
MTTARRQVDAVIVGSGPGGATVARGLADAGKKVLLLEKGRDLRWIGNHFSALMMADKMGMSFTKEGLNIVRAFVTGGSTIMYCGSAAQPPSWLKEKYGIDLMDYAGRTVKELSLKPLPDEIVGTGGLRILEAANELGYHFEKMPKFINPAKCRMICGGTCMLGCPHGAKWTAREYIGDMLRAGGELMTRADVRSVTIEDGTATGLTAHTAQGTLEVRAKVVVIAAGGIGTPSILKKSGLREAGEGMFVDPLVFVTGVSRHKGTCQGPPMSVGTYEFIDEGILLSDLIDPWAMWIVMALRRNPSKILDFFSYRRQLALMVKIGDERKGFITEDGDISKPLTRRDRGRLDRGADLSKKILIKAGCDPRSIMVGPVRGAHPGATARIGEVVDENLETRVKNLFVSDASVLPEALDRPLVLTIISLSKRLSDHLLANAF